MQEQFEIFFSNRLEVLYRDLKEQLCSSFTKPFTKRMVVVYGPAMKNWLILQMARDKDLGICTGIEIVYLNEAFEKLTEIFQMNNGLAIPSSTELAFSIEKEITKILKTYPQLSKNKQQAWQPVINYLKVDPTKLDHSTFFSRKAEKRLITLSQHISKCFKEYGRFAGALTCHWEDNKNELADWQEDLWKNLYSSENEWTYPAKLFQQPMSSPAIDLEVFFFSISFINQNEFQFIHELASSIPMYYSMLSPCAVFWSDIRSDKESSYLQKYWQRRLGYDSSNLSQLEELLRDRNPLLANFGRLGREVVSRIEETGIQTRSLYQLPESILQLNEDALTNEDIDFVESNGSLTLLEAVQSDLLLMRNPQDSSKIDLNEHEPSIQLHSAHTKRREIEIIYHKLLELIDKNNSISPSDIIVMAPQIMDYVPYIQAQFGTQSSLLDFQILDLGVQAQGAILQGFLQLIAISESRWDATSLLQLFENTAFQRRHQISNNDFSLLQQWIEMTGIRWGEDVEHRNEILEKNHCKQGMVDETSVGTWNHGFERLLMGLITARQDKTFLTSLDVIPAEIEFSQAETLGKWIKIFDSLRDDLAPLNDRSSMKIEEWINYLNCLLESYFQYDFNDSSSQDDYMNLRSQFELLRPSSKYLKDSHFSFISIKSHFENLLQQRTLSFRENHLQTVSFCSMMPLRSIPAKLIVLLGMQEGAFPRQEEKLAINLSIDKELTDYCPSPIDYDRYLFLEVLHSAREHLIISYQGYSQQDGKTLQPSLVIEELFNYLDKYYSLQGKKVSQVCTYKHPFDAFDPLYFQKDSIFKNYSSSDFKLAQLQQYDLKTPSYSFVKSFIWNEHPQIETIPHKSIIDIKYLSALVKDPIKFYLNRTLDIYLETTEDRSIKNEEGLFLDALDKYQINRFSLKEPLPILLSQAEKEGKLPFGLFKDVASKKIKDEIEDIQGRLQKFDLNPNDLFKIEFSTSCSVSTQVDEHSWIYPAINLAYSQDYQIQIVGELPSVSKKGLVALSKGALSDTWKIWPQYLLFHYASQMYPSNLEKQLLSIHTSKPKKAFFIDPEPYLKDLVNYYAISLKNFSPLLPEWIPSILKNDMQGLKEKMEQVFSAAAFGSEYHGKDLRWILNKDRLPCAEEIIGKWKPQAELLFKDVAHHWYPSKSENQEDS